MEEQKGVTEIGGTMRLGGVFVLFLKPGSKAYEAYASANGDAGNQNGELTISERHRHRYEYNNRLPRSLGEARVVEQWVKPATGAC